MGYQGEQPQCHPLPPRPCLGQISFSSHSFAPGFGMTLVARTVPCPESLGTPGRGTGRGTAGEGEAARAHIGPCPSARALDPAGEAAAIAPHGSPAPGGTRRAPRGPGCTVSAGCCLLLPSGATGGGMLGGINETDLALLLARSSCLPALPSLPRSAREGLAPLTLPLPHLRPSQGMQTASAGFALAAFPEETPEDAGKSWASYKPHVSRLLAGGPAASPGQGWDGRL